MALFKRHRKKAGKAAADPGEPQGTQQAAVDGTDPEGGEPAVLKAPILIFEDAAKPPDDTSATEPPPEEPAVEQTAAGPVNETLPLALEPELRKIIDTAVARVASIELEAIRESRQLTQRSEEEGREALKYALDKSLQLVNSFELLTVTIAGMVSALRVELDAATAALHRADDPYSHLSRGADPGTAAPEALPPVESPRVLEDTAIRGSGEVSPQGVQGMNGDGPEIHTQPNERLGRFTRRFFSRK